MEKESASSRGGGGSRRGLGQDVSRGTHGEGFEQAGAELPAPEPQLARDAARDGSRVAANGQPLCREVPGGPGQMEVTGDQPHSRQPQRAEQLCAAAGVAAGGEGTALEPDGAPVEAQVLPVAEHRLCLGGLPPAAPAAHHHPGRYPGAKQLRRPGHAAAQSRPRGAVLEDATAQHDEDVERGGVPWVTVRRRLGQAGQGGAEKWREGACWRLHLPLASRPKAFQGAPCIGRFFAERSAPLPMTTDADSSRPAAKRTPRASRRRRSRSDAPASTELASDPSEGLPGYHIEGEPPTWHASVPPPELIDIEFDEERIDPDAAKVVRRLTRHGYEAYLVGGCVRDLLVDRNPKDFDVATSALPDDVRALFRNSRIIGRRFRLVHILFGGGRIIETATFRRNPQPDEERDSDDLLIRHDNVFGEAHEDAVRRDFTINGLFYDIDRKRVIDWVGGMEHIRARTVHTIGDPVTRFLEDPVRILRAIKFAARLDFGMSPAVYDAIVQCRGSLAMAARPRLFEEILRLMRGGAAHRSLWLAWETGVLDVLLPELAAYVSDVATDEGSVWKLLSEVDRRTALEGPLDDAILWSILLLEPLSEACAGVQDRVTAAHEFLEPVVDRLNVPRRIADMVRRIVAMLPKIESGKGSRLSRSALYPLALQVLDIRQAALGQGGRPRRRRRR